MSEGSAADSVVDLYRRHGRAWAALRGERLIEAAWLERFAALLPPDAAVLDLGCGPGVPIARWLASRGFRVTGIDAAPSMIELARTSLPAQTWHVADMRDLDLGQRFAGILAWDSFFHLDAAAQRAMFAVFAAHALVGAGLMFTSRCSTRASPAASTGRCSSATASPSSPSRTRIRAAAATRSGWRGGTARRTRPRLDTVVRAADSPGAAREGADDREATR
jgi:SAM-dependent methyltransferase